MIEIVVSNRAALFVIEIHATAMSKVVVFDKTFLGFLQTDAHPISVHVNSQNIFLHVRYPVVPKCIVGAFQNIQSCVAAAKNGVAHNLTILVSRSEVDSDAENILNVIVLEENLL